MRVRALPAVLSLASLAFALVFSSRASAQELNVSRVTGNLPRGAPGTVGVNRQDCVDGRQLTFSLAITNLNGTYDLQVWAGESGADCSDLNNRSGTNVARCRQVAAPQRTTSATFQIDVSARDLAAILSGPPQPSSFQAAGLDACDAQTTPSARTVGVYFLLMNGTNVIKSTTFKPTGTSSSTTSTTTQQEGVVVDMLGPSPPTNVRTSTGDRRLRVDWTPTGDRDIKGYVFYCQKSSDAPTDAATQTTRVCPDAATTTVDAGDDGAVADAAAADACVETTSPVVTGGTCPTPTVSAATECGRLIQTGASSGNTDRVLENKGSYAVAVAAIDAFDNVGEAAPAADCGVPEAVADFWREYNAAGGSASGFCAQGPGAADPASSALLVVASACATLVAFRRGARRRGAR